MGRLTRRPLETKDLDNDGGRGDRGVLTPATPVAYPQVLSRRQIQRFSSTSVVEVANHGLVQRHRRDRCARLSM
jgi:hypothetical protein